MPEKWPYLAKLAKITRQSIFQIINNKIHTFQEHFLAVLTSLAFLQFPVQLPFAVSLLEEILQYLEFLEVVSGVLASRDRVCTHRTFRRFRRIYGDSKLFPCI